MGRMQLGAVVAAVVSAVALAACGSSGPSAAEKKEAAERRAKAHALAVAGQCRDQLGDFISALEDLESRLTVGLNYDDYLSEVGEVTVVYNKIPLGKLDLPCLNHVGVFSEKALQEYAEAAETWQDCIDELCESDSIDPELQASWSRATGLIARAQGGMTELREP